MFRRVDALEVAKRCMQAEEENAELKQELIAERNRLVDLENALSLACESICKKENCDNDVTKCWKEFFLIKAREPK